MRQYSVREVFLAPVFLCIAMGLSALVTGHLAGVNSKGLFVPYVLASVIFTCYALLLTSFWWVSQLARAGADRPLLAVRKRFLEQAPCLLLPLLIFPVFLASFTATKTGIPFLVGYSWDPFWAHADRLLFGDDAWRIAHHWLGEGVTRPLAFMYYIAWGLCLLFVAPLVALNASARFTGKFFTAMMATWLIGGAGMAYLFASAGPVFAHLVSPNSPDQFADLRRVLDLTLLPHGPIRTGLLYLPHALYSRDAVMGGGMSAMPSMHLATVSIYVLGARRTRWFIPSVLFWLIIFVSSAYFGFHYWMDGIVAAGLAVVCWAAATRLSQRLGKIGDRTDAPHIDGDGIIGQPLPGGPLAAACPTEITSLFQAGLRQSARR
jgi:hypothetical protein